MAERLELALGWRCIPRVSLPASLKAVHGDNRDRRETQGFVVMAEIEYAMAPTFGGPPPEISEASCGLAHDHGSRRADTDFENHGICTWTIINFSERI